MKVVFDTNVLVSALTFPGGRGEAALGRVIDGRDELLLSKPLLDELLGVLAGKFGREAEELARVAVFLADLGQMIEPDIVVAELTDQGDNEVLACALTGAARAIVTGDREILELGRFRGTAILSLREYLETSV